MLRNIHRISAMARLCSLHGLQDQYPYPSLADSYMRCRSCVAVLLLTICDWIMLHPALVDRRPLASVSSQSKVLAYLLTHLNTLHCNQPNHAYIVLQTCLRIRKKGTLAYINIIAAGPHQATCYMLQVLSVTKRQSSWFMFRLVNCRLTHSTTVLAILPCSANAISQTRVLDCVSLHLLLGPAPSSLFAAFLLDLG
jgi:hypothetical protein